MDAKEAYQLYLDARQETSQKFVELTDDGYSLCEILDDFEYENLVQKEMDLYSQWTALYQKKWMLDNAL